MTRHGETGAARHGTPTPTYPTLAWRTLTVRLNMGPAEDYSMKLGKMAYYPREWPLARLVSWSVLTPPMSPSETAVISAEQKCGYDMA